MGSQMAMCVIYVRYVPCGGSSVRAENTANGCTSIEGIALDEYTIFTLYRQTRNMLSFVCMGCEGTKLFCG